MNPLSKSLNYGIGLFETISVKNGQLEYLDEHLERLIQSIDALNVPYDVSQETLKNSLKIYCENHYLNEGVVKIVIGDTSPVDTITHRPNPYEATTYNRGFKISIADIRRHSSNPLWQHKTTNYWLNIMVKNLADVNEEIIFLNEEDLVTEGTVSNLFLLKNGIVKTPDISCGLLPGVMRRQVLNQCGKLNIEIQECQLTTEDLLESDSLFITNSVMGVMPVTEFLGIPKETLPFVVKLMEVLNGS